MTLMKREIIMKTDVIPVKDKKVVLGLSGGVDSTTACLLLQQKGYEVTGLYFNVLSEKCINSRENIRKGREKAERAAKELGIQFIYKDMSQEFEKTVIRNFCDEYICGRTPNPCIMCNPNVKFKVLSETADEIGAEYIATGHYAGTFYDEATGNWHIRKAANEAKDQSYMLYRLPQNIISRLILPLNDVADKEEVREKARTMKLSNADASDSQEICFIDKEDNYEDFIRRMGITSRPGRFVNREGEVLGEHKGVIHYTIGQRKGLGIALGKPAFVTEIDGDNNRIILGDNEELFKKEVISSDNVFACDFKDGIRVTAKIRYAARPAEAMLRNNCDGTVSCIFDDPQRAPTPGQSIVFYVNDILIGGGFIK